MNAYQKLLEEKIDEIHWTLHGLQNSGESMGDSDLHSDFGPVTW